MFVYQPTLSTLQIKYKKTSENVVSWKSKGVYTMNVRLLHGAFLPQLRYDAGNICVNLANSPLVVEQNNYSTKIVIVYDLNDWPKVLLRNLTLKKCLFGATNILKNSDKEKCLYSNYGIV